MPKFNFLLFLIILFLPLISFAGTYIASSSNATYTVTYEGLVPCGKNVQVDGQTLYIPCQFCHFFVLFKGVIDFLLFKLVAPLAILFLAIGGIMYFCVVFEFLPGGPQLLNQAKSLLTSVVIGLLIIFSAWLLINLFFMLIGVADWTGLRAGWWQINCPIRI